MRIVWTSDAKSEYRQTLRFWMQNNDTDKYAVVIAGQVKSYLNTIKKYPYLGRIVSERNKYRRIVILRSYSLYYTLLEESNTIVVFAFKDNRSDPKKLTFL